MTFQSFSVSKNTAAGDSNPHQVLVKSVQLARKIRVGFFGDDLFGDPAWEILLELYACELEERRISVSSAGAAAGIPPTTALRWIAILETKNLAQRKGDPFDGRRAWISLTSDGKSLMHRYFSATSVTCLT